jgi:hypothetical protein
MEKRCHRVARGELQYNGICFQDICKRVIVGQVKARELGTLELEKGCHRVARGELQDNGIGFQDICKRTKVGKVYGRELGK